MSYKLCVAEKPSVAKDIARVIGADKKENGYYIGNGYIVTWAVGHLVGLAEPDAYGFVKQEEMYANEESKQRAYSELPLLPREFKLIVLDSTKEQFKVVKELMHRNDVDEIIDCGDMGPEGHILQWFIRTKAGNTKPVKRFCATSMTDEAIKYAMKHLRDVDEFMPVIRGEFCKKREDWILGMSLSRALSIKYDAGISVGRVQSPTLGFVVRRYIEVMTFKPQKFYTLKATVSTGKDFDVFWKKDGASKIAPNAKMSDGRVLVRDVLENEARAIMELGSGVVSSVSVVKRAMDRPQLYDITELQRDANEKYGYSAALTLATAQALYETQKILSYPRTDSRYITEDLKPYMVERVRALCETKKYGNVAKGILKDGLNIDEKIVDDKKVTDHHALIPTEKIEGFDVANMVPTSEERRKGVTSEGLFNILDLVLSRFLVAFSKPYKYEQTDVDVEFSSGMCFSARGKRPVQMGWKDVQATLETASEIPHREELGDEQIFPALNKGQLVMVKECVVGEGETTAPKLHTEATLLTAMENAGRYIDNGEILKGKGIGTQATRGEIIKKLFDTGVVETVLKGKTPYIKPTKKGLTIIRILPPDLYSPKITADWENKIADVVEGKITEDELMSDFYKYIQTKTEQIKASENIVDFSKETMTFGDCPWCGNPVYRFQTKGERGKPKETRYFCSKKCDWELRTNDLVFQTRLGRAITEAEAKKFILNKTIILNCISKSTGNKYSGLFSFCERKNNGRRYCNVKCDLVQNSHKKKNSSP